MTDVEAYANRQKQVIESLQTIKARLSAVVEQEGSNRNQLEFNVKGIQAFVSTLNQTIQKFEQEIRNGNLERDEIRQQIEKTNKDVETVTDSNQLLQKNLFDIGQKFQQGERLIKKFLY